MSIRGDSVTHSSYCRLLAVAVVYLRLSSRPTECDVGYNGN